MGILFLEQKAIIPQLPVNGAFHRMVFCAPKGCVWGNAELSPRLGGSDPRDGPDRTGRTGGIVGRTGSCLGSRTTS